MFRYVPFEQLEEKHINGIAECLLAAPEDTRLESSDLLRGLYNGNMRLFDWSDGCIIVAKQGRRLAIYSFCCHNLLRRLPELVADLKRLAADWECDKIETTCFDTRLSRAIQRLGGSVESVNLVLPVE